MSRATIFYDCQCSTCLECQMSPPKNAIFRRSIQSKYMAKDSDLSCHRTRRSDRRVLKWLEDKKAVFEHNLERRMLTRRSYRKITHLFALCPDIYKEIIFLCVINRTICRFAFLPDAIPVIATTKYDLIFDVKSYSASNRLR